jgi:spermidine dehydrogenase
MNKSDRELGMHRDITRRDFLSGVAMTVGTSLLPGGASAQASGSPGPDPSPLDPLLAKGITPGDRDYYPPAQTGMRGAHPGSFEAMHACRDGKTWDNPQDTGETYDLVVVGGGISGLAAAYFFRKSAGPGARILILDNHDDFGGHAKRNEFTHGSRMLMATGGTAYIAQGSRWTYDGRTLLQDVGVNLQDSKQVDESGLYSSMGLRPGVFFNKEQFGKDSLIVDHGPPSHDGYAMVPSSARYLARTPLSKRVQEDYARLFTDKRDYFPGLSREQKIHKLQSMSYRDYLLNVLHVHPDVLPLLGGVWCMDESSASAWLAFFRSKPGFEGLGFEPPGSQPEAPDLEHFMFPGGNSEIARLIVKWLIPSSLPGDVKAPASPGDLLTQRLNYARLDEPGSPARIRLNSTAVRVRHTGAPVDPEDGISLDTREVDVTYVNGDKAYRVRGKNCVLACNNNVIPYLCPELPGKQKEALHMASRAVNLMVNVLVRNWTSFHKLGASHVTAPWSFYPTINLAEPISYGTYRASLTPQEPMIMSLGIASPLNFAASVRGLCGGRSMPLDMPVRDKMRVLRAGMYTTPFEVFERNARELMGRALGSGSFDPGRDIEAITVNRWPHGLTLGSNTLFDPNWTDDEVPWVVGRKQFGRITIANSDASGMDLSQSAIDEAHRAVEELELRGQWLIRPRI